MKENKNGKETQGSGKDRNEPKREICRKPNEEET
jgi:hypothetical protein